MDKDKDNQDKIEPKGRSDHPSRPCHSAGTKWDGVRTENWVFPLFETKTPAAAVSARTRYTPQLKTEHIPTIPSKTADARRRSNSLEEEGQNEGQTERDKRLWLIHQKRQLRNMDLDALRRRIVTLEREMHENGGTRSGLPMPTTFDGTTDLQDYLKSFNLIATAHNWTPARCVQVLPLFLRGSARAIYEGIGSDVKDNWRSLIDAMADKLKQMSPSLTARQKLAQRKQLNGESLEEFAQAIRNLVLRAYPDNSLEMDLGNLVLGALENDVKHANEARLRQFRSEIARDFFRANMAPRLKERVMYMEEPQTLEEAVAQASRVEQVQGNLADDMWKNTQDAKAEVALAEVNAVRTELNEIREQQQRTRENQGQNQREWQNQNHSWRGNNTEGQNQQNFWRGNNAEGQNQSNFWRGNPEFRPIRRGNFTPRGFTGYPRGLNTYRGGFNPRGANANFTPLGSNFQGTNNNGNFQPNFNQNQNWPRGRGPTGPNRGRGGSDADRGRTGWRVNEVNFPFICLMTIMAAMFLPADGQYQLCPSKPTEGITVTMSFPEEQNCTLPVERPPLTVKSNLYIPIRIPRVFPAFKCWNVTTVTCTESFLRIMTLDHPDKKIEAEASVEDCQASIHHSPMNRVSETRWESLAPIRKEYGWYGVNCFNNVQTVIEEGKAGILDGKRLITSWGDSLKIDKSLGEDGSWIRLPGAVELLMWKIPSDEFWHSHFVIGPVITEIWPKKAVIVDELQYTFPISRNQERKFPVFGVPDDALKTDNNVYVHVIGKVNSTKRARQRRETDGTNKKAKLTKGQIAEIATTTHPIATTHIPPTTRPIATTHIPPTTRPIATTHIPPTTRPIAITHIPPTTRPIANTHIPPTTHPIATTHIPPTTRPIATTHIPPTTRPIATTHIPPTTRPIATTHIPPTTRPIATTHIPPTIRPISTTNIPSTTRPIVTTQIPPIIRPITTNIPPITRPISTTPTTPIQMTTKFISTISPPTTLYPNTTSNVEDTTVTESYQSILDELKGLAEQTNEEGTLLSPPVKVTPTPFILSDEPNEESPTTVVTKREIPDDDESEKLWKEENLDHENSRLNYLGWKTHRTNIQNAREKWMSDCHERNNALSIAKALARQMPEDAARSLYKRDDITAFWTRSSQLDQKWSIALCRQLKAEDVLWDQKIGGKCFRELPVVVARRTLFVKPGTRDLSYNGTQTHCDEQGNNPWATDFNNNDTELQQANSKHRFVSKHQTNFQNPLIFFTRGSIFESEQARLEQNLKELTRRITRPELNFPDIGTVDINQTEIHGSTVTDIFSIGEILVEKMQKEGESFRKKAEETIEKGKAWMEDPIGIIKYIKWILITIAIILLLVGCTVLLWKIKIYTTLLLTPIHLLQSLVNTLTDCFNSGRRLAEQVRYPIVMEVELQDRARPSAPPEEPLLDQKAYVLNYLPNICQIEQTKRKKKRCYVNFFMNGVKTKALFDTGADITYIGYSTAQRCFMMVRKGDYPQARAANSTPIRFIGSAIANIKLGDFEGKFPIHRQRG
ncbi:hypothetical protein niasHT_003396 [Heterodera trifolii]|uniref:Peptidase A2 domain-containing protein n=1 Tax=Heterodera trifolii TaxID=157864 RepID=A0ABD2LNQ2_9BILA